MNSKRFLVASLVVFVAMQAMGFVVETLILMSTYEALKHLWRPDMMDKMWIWYVTGLLVAFLFTYIFIQGREGKGLMEGVRYGIIMWLLMSVPMSHAFYAVIAIPYSLCLAWCASGLIQFLVVGILVAAIYKPAAPKAA